MSRGRQSQQGIPKGKSVQTINPFDAVVQGITIYMEVANAARLKLLQEKVLPTGIDIRIQVERNFCMNILVNICKLKQSYIQGLVREIHKDKEKFEEEVKGFCEVIVPKKERHRIVPSKDFRKEVEMLTRRDKVFRKGGKIIKP